MKVLLVNGSPHETGNTYQTLRIISECLDFTFSEMPIVSSNYWNMVVDPNPDRIHRDKYGQEIRRTLAVNMSFMLHQMESRKG